VTITPSGFARRRGLLLLGFIAACGVVPEWMHRPVEQMVASDELREGRDIYRCACASCHGKRGRGDGRQAARLATRPTDVTRLAARHDGVFPREYVIAIVTGETQVTAHGTREMPVWRRRFASPSPAAPEDVASFYAQRQLELLVAYLERLQVGAGRHR